MPLIEFVKKGNGLKVKIKKGYKLRKVAGEYIVIPLTDTAKTVNGIFRLNNEASGLFKLFLTEKSVDDGVKHLVDNYGISEEQALSDVKDFIDVLENYDMIEE